MGSDEKPVMAEWAATARPLHGEMTSGDMRVAQSFRGMDSLWAKDGLGNNEEAIQDNGATFTKQANPSSSSQMRLGLPGLLERLRLVNGQFGMRLHQGKWTTIRAEISTDPRGRSRYSEKKHPVAANKNTINAPGQKRLDPKSLI